MGGDPVGGTPLGGDPVGGTPLGGDPVGGTPVGGDPVGGGGGTGGVPPPPCPDADGDGQPGAPETCNGLDDDCDGASDDGFGVGEACDVGVGACLAIGHIVCLADGSAACDVAAGDGSGELCNEIDDDCNGVTDDVPGLGDGCSAGVGACRGEGRFVCDLAGERTICNAVAGAPGVEICDGVDNDCDAAIDDGFDLGAACAVGEGACRAEGGLVCADGGGAECSATAGVASEEVCDGVDNDCDGEMDDGFDLGTPCTVGEGACRVEGTMVCRPGGSAGCDALAGEPVAEVCDGVDNDCNGLVDDAACSPPLFRPPFVRVEPGTFTMGSPLGEPGRRATENEHLVTLTRPLYVKATEVTQREWFAAFGTEPSSFSACGPDCPVESVTWFEAIAYCNALSADEYLRPCYVDGAGNDYDLQDAAAQVLPVWRGGAGCLGYRLPTEAEWEYLARAGVSTATYAGAVGDVGCGLDPTLDVIAWYCGNAGDATHPVAIKEPNPWGIYDTLGNVAEWAWDFGGGVYSDPSVDPTGPAVGDRRVVRGGNWSSPALGVRAAMRDDIDHRVRSVLVGLRPVRTAAHTPPGFVRIEPGTFMMGSPPDELGRDADETQRQVTITRAFYLKATEVTQGEWFATMGNRPSRFGNCGNDCPVERVDWFDVIAYANRRSVEEGLRPCYLNAAGNVYDIADAGASTIPLWPEGLGCVGYRLPTEAEWEYAARGGTTTSTYLGDIAVLACGSDPVLDRLAWHCGNSAVAYAGCRDLRQWGGAACAGTHPAATREPNAWGLHDMLGGVYEWVWDVYGDYPQFDQSDPLGPAAGPARTIRGGSWYYEGSMTRASDREWDGPADGTSDSKGFRIARTVVVDPPPVVLIEAGRFAMGSPLNEPGRLAIEGPQHEVTITRPFVAMTREVSQGLWSSMGLVNPSPVVGPELPVYETLWTEAVDFANRLSERAGITPCYESDGAGGYFWPQGLDCPGWRLPTEAEWEFMSRAGDVGPRFGPLSDVAWWPGHPEMTDPPRPLVSGSLSPNAWGLYDTLGNVSEWTWDFYGPYSGTPAVDPHGAGVSASRVNRGGKFNAPLEQVDRFRHAYRSAFRWADERGPGVRLVRTVRAR